MARTTRHNRQSIAKRRSTRARRARRTRRTRHTRRTRRRTSSLRRRKRGGGSPKKRHFDKPCIILFHMNGCGACSSFMPVWHEYVKNHSGLCTKTVELSQLNGMAEKLKQPWIADIRSFPTIVGVSSNGDRIAEFQGPRTTQGLEEFAHRIKLN